MSPDRWWREGVIYQIYVRSFADSNGDGVGDLGGVIDRLDHLVWLGVDALWLSPIHPSPNADWGYDVSDYMAVDPELGDLETFDRLVAEAGARDLRVLLDLVPNHTSDRHPWFVDSRSDRGARHRDWYVWADPGPGGEPPNNWVSAFGGPAWTWDERTHQFYLHNFLPHQPDLNWWNEELRDAFDEILRFWFDRGIAGFRIDVANGLVHDRELRDNPGVTDEDHPRIRALGLRPVHNMNRPEVHQIFRRWRRLADADVPRLLIGETWLFDLPTLMRYYGTGTDELHLAMNFPFIFSEFGAQTREIVEATEAAMRARAWPVWTASNHDAGRFPSRWCGGDERAIRSALVALLGLRGTPILYQGDEIGMLEVPVPRERLRDPVGVRGWPDDRGRDPARTPMHWSPEPGAGFTTPEAEPWLPIGDAGSVNVADQRDDRGSILHLCRDLLALRRSTPELRSGAYASLPAPPEVWAWRRGDRLIAALNLSEREQGIDLGRGTILIGTDRARDRAAVNERLTLPPRGAVVVRLDG